MIRTHNFLRRLTQSLVSADFLLLNSNLLSLWPQLPSSCFTLGGHNRACIYSQTVSAARAGVEKYSRLIHLAPAPWGSFLPSPCSLVPTHAAFMEDGHLHSSSQHLTHKCSMNIYGWVGELMNFVQLCAPFPSHYLLHASPVIYHITGKVKFGRDLLVTPLQRCQLLGMKVDSATRHLGPP